MDRSQFLWRFQQFTRLTNKKGRTTVQNILDH